jgi:hypothetical protein
LCQGCLLMIHNHSMCSMYVAISTRHFPYRRDDGLNRPNDHGTQLGFSTNVTITASIEALLTFTLSYDVAM